MGNTIKRMFSPRVPEGQQTQQEINQNNLQAIQTEKNNRNRFFTQQQQRQIHQTMPQISNLKNIKPVSWTNAQPFTKKGKQIIQLKTHINNKNTININKTNKKYPIHSKFVFHFIRHAESCSNEQQTKSERIFKKINSGSEIEPFISNKGILDCNDSKHYYKTILVSSKIANYFCSCLQRTWDTAYILFGKDNIEKFMVGPYLKENKASPSNLPVLYNENVWRFNFFKEYVDKLIEKSPSNSSANSPQQASSNSSAINSQQKNRQNSKECPRYSGDGSSLYPPIYYESDLDKFILWYVENFKLLNKCNNSNKEIRVVIVCHSHIIQEFVKKRMSLEKFKQELIKKGLNINITDYDDYFKKYFNYCISVNVEYNTSQNTKKEIINKYNKDYNKSLDLLQGSKHSNTLTNNNKFKTSENTIKNMVPVCGFGNICVRKISIGYIGNDGTTNIKEGPSPICKFSKNQNFTSNKILSGI